MMRFHPPEQVPGPFRPPRVARIQEHHDGRGVGPGAVEEPFGQAMRAANGSKYA